MFDNNQIIPLSNTDLDMKTTRVLAIQKEKNYLFIKLENGKRLLTNGNEIYDVSNYDFFSDIFHMKEKTCAVLRKDDSTYVVDLKTMEVLFEDEYWCSIVPNDDRTIAVTSDIHTSLYDIETKNYIPTPLNYIFENNLGNDLYVFKEETNSETSYYDYKRCIIRVDGKVILKDIEGWIEKYNNYLIIKKTNQIDIVKIEEDNTLTVNTVMKNENTIASPSFNNGNIILIEKGIIKLLSVDLELINQFEINEMDVVHDYEIVSDVLKLYISSENDEMSKYTLLFVHLKSGKIISHSQLDGYPYWNPTIFVGADKNHSPSFHYEYGKTYEPIEYYFYDSDFNLVTSMMGDYCESVDDNIFAISQWDGQEFKRKFINSETGTIKECDYNSMKFLLNDNYGYAFHTKNDTMDIIDRDFNVRFTNINYRQLGISINNCFLEFYFFVVNDTLCIVKIINDGPNTLYRNIIQNKDGEIIYDSLGDKCFPIGNFIQIYRDGKSIFYNTLTGEMGQFTMPDTSDNNALLLFNQTPLLISHDMEEIPKTNIKRNIQ